MKKVHTQKAANTRQQSRVTAAYLDNFTFLQKFLARYFTEQQDIEDVVQETYLRAYSTEQSKIIEYPKAFLFQIAKNLALTELNKKSRQITDYIEDFDLPIVIDLDDPVTSDVEAKQNLGLYCEAVAALPIQCRRVYLLRKVHGLSHKEIAERMGVTVSSVEKHLLKGVLKCRAYIKEREAGKRPVEAADKARNSMREGKQ